MKEFKRIPIPVAYHEREKQEHKRDKGRRKKGMAERESGGEIGTDGAGGECN